MSTHELCSVNVGRPKQIVHGGKMFETGIFKSPVEGPVRLGSLGLEGDGQVDMVAHGGPYRAAYAYTVEHYAFWREALGRDSFPYGQFGENLAVRGLFENEVCIGDVLRVGAALVQVSQPRAPCYKLEARMEMKGFAREFLRSGRIGFYLRVLEEGVVQAGDAIEVVSRDAAGMTVVAVANLMYFEKGDREGAARAARLEALTPGWREEFEVRAG